MVAQLSCCCCCHKEPQNQTWLSRLCLKPILGSWELAAPVIFGEEAELAHVWVLLWLPGLSGVDRLILASSIYPGRSCSSARLQPLGADPCLHSSWNSCWELRGSRDTAQGCCCAFPALLTWGPCGIPGSEAAAGHCWAGEQLWDEQLSLGEAFPRVLLGSASSPDHPT